MMMGSGGAEDAAKTKVGAKVTLVDGKRGGTVKFVGETVYGPGIWLGIELEKRTGLHDGMHNGKRYFFCRDGHGIYVRADQVVEKNKNWFGGGNAAVRMIQSFVRGSKERQVSPTSQSYAQRCCRASRAHGPADRGDVTAAIPNFVGLNCVASEYD
jgi:hypothetical protein